MDRRRRKHQIKAKDVVTVQWKYLQSCSNKAYNLWYLYTAHKGYVKWKSAYEHAQRIRSSCACKINVQGPVVQSVVSLTSSLRVISLTVLADSIHNILIFFAEKM